MDHLTELEASIIRLGIFVVFIVTFGDFVFRKIWPVLGPLFQQQTENDPPRR
jgi:hypothetical protein